MVLYTAKTNANAAYNFELNKQWKSDIFIFLNFILSIRIWLVTSHKFFKIIEHTINIVKYEL